MTVHSFKNGIEIHIPPEITFRQWTDTKMIMDILIGTPSRGEPVRFYPDGRMAGNKKTWRSPKKLKQ